MSNKERYKRTFSAVHTSRDYSKEVFEMKKSYTRVHFSRTLAACLAACLMLGSAGFCYAANIGGIQRQVQLWINGDKTAAVIDFNGEGEYTLSYKDSEGNLYSQSGGGVAFDKDGNERPATEQELLDEINAPNVEYKDGKAIFTFYDQVLDITNLFVDDVCYITINHEGKPKYITVKYQNGLAMSPNRYLNPEEFN